MSPTIVDHVLFSILILAVPLWARWGYRRLLRRLEEGVPDPRVVEYRNTLRVQWSFTLVLLFWWYLSGRPWTMLGFGHVPTGPSWIGPALTAIAVGFLVVQMIVVGRSERHLREFENQIEDLRGLLPHDGREAAWFRAVSITAGVCEEIAFRGFLIAYLQPLLGLGGAVLLSSLAFGLGHLYQGRRGVLKTSAVGVAMGTLYVLSGSLWAPILVHVLIDLNSGELARRVLQREPTLPWLG